MVEIILYSIALALLVIAGSVVVGIAAAIMVAVFQYVYSIVDSILEGEEE